MENKTNTRVTIDIPVADHKKLKMLAAYYGKSMREIFVELIERGLEHYEHYNEPNKVTKAALEKVKKRKGLRKASTVKELFEKLGK